MSNQLHQELRAAIDRCMIRDRFRFEKELHARQSRQRLAREVAESVAKAEQRASNRPLVTFPDNLPLCARIDDIKSAIAANQVVIIAGETGSGKTTQLPKICLDMGRGVFGMIGHTQPRRVAARTVAHRIAEELGVAVGEQVGYQVRFTDKSSTDTHIKVMTDGILLAETQQDRFLERYDTLIIDEAHERSLNIDFLLGYLKRILPRRPDLKVIVTSATIDLDRFSRHFNNAPVIVVSGRTFPVAVHYRPPPESKQEDSDEQVYRGVLDVLEEIRQLERGRGSPGDVLVFLPGEREIRELAQEIRKHRTSDVEVLPLYSRLSVAEQNRVFEAKGRQRIVLATNVAETSLTVPRIRYVIDPGLARISHYSVRSKVQQLPIEPIAKASAEQRKGRCGRVSDGVCFRLYEEADFDSRPDYTPPEITRTNLASVILQMLALKLGDISKFPFVERPDQKQINDGFQLLKEVQAVDDHRGITKIGKDMARFPVDLRLARMLIEAGRTGCLKEVLTIVSALGIQDPRDRPHEARQAADEAHRAHWHERSDFLTYVNLWDFYESQRQQLGQGRLRRFCREHFLSYPRMQEWRDNHRQLRLICKEADLKENREPADYSSIHRALLSGLLGNIGERVEENEYLGARNRRHFIFPGSSQFKRKPRWIMSAELVETTRLYARTVADIDSEWVEPLSRHLVKRNFHEPFFDRGQVFAFEEVMLYGLSIVKKRKTDYGAVNPVRARQIFIQSGLVEQQLDSSAGFYRHNAKLFAEVEKMESKARKRDILVDENTLYRFYDERLPENICSEIDLDAWRKIAERKTPRLLYLTVEDLIKQAAELPEHLYPSSLEVGNTRLALDYHFDPQHEDDGVNVNVPVSMLRQVDGARLDFLIPGMLREKCLALIKSLPKSIRKNFVPAPDYVDRVMPLLTYDGRKLEVVLAEKLLRLTGVKVPIEAFDTGAIDRHLRMNVRVLGNSGEVLARGRDLGQLRQSFAAEVDEAFQHRARHDIEATGLTNWVFGDLPAQVSFEQAGVKLVGYPRLVDHGQTVAIEVIDDESTANRTSRQGLLRLIMLQLNEQRRYLEKNFPHFAEFALYYATRGSAEELRADLVEATFRYTFIEDRPVVRTRSQFDERLKDKQHLVTMANEVGDLMRGILVAKNRIGRLLGTLRSPATEQACRDVEAQLQRMLAARFVRSTPLCWLRHLPRYLAAVEYRLDKLRLNLARDGEMMAEVNRFEARLATLPDHSRIDAEQFRWMLEEYRVSLFAQGLGTSVPVSAKRLDKVWQAAMTGGQEWVH